MNLGTENKKKTIAAVSLGVLALALIVYQLYPSSSPAPVATAPPAVAPGNTARTGTTPAPTRRNGQKTVVLPRINSLDPTIRLDLLQQAESQHYHSSGRNIFEAHTAEEVAAVHKPKPPPPAPVVYTPPPPPPINLKFYGYTEKPGQPTRVFLSQGDEVFIASEGDLVANRYKILHIHPTSIDVEDVLNSNQQSLPLQAPPS